MPDSKPTAGTITDLDVQTNDTDRRSVFVDGEFAFGVHQDLVAKHGLRVGATLTVEERQAIEAEDQAMRAKQRALDYLAYKPRTEQEVRRKLEQEDVPPAVVEDVVARIKELGYLDDETYAHDYARNRFSNKQYGPERIRRELRERGIDRHLADAAVDDVFADADPVEVARAHAEKRWSRIDPDADPRRQKQKLYRYLKRRGFTSDTVYRILDEFVDDRSW
jgi:regulatory protein